MSRMAIAGFDTPDLTVRATRLPKQRTVSHSNIKDFLVRR